MKKQYNRFEGAAALWRKKNNGFVYRNVPAGKHALKLDVQNSANKLPQVHYYHANY